ILQKISSFGLNILYRVIEKEQGKPEVMHAHFAGVGYTASKLNKRTHIPFVITEHLSTMMKPVID
ncbi:MAG: glycosyltransferase family 4 protein, partial [Tissierellia bacterium]|nr:glycosyltransferase family 4 protein [Tissierellia bacterium]